MSISKVAYEHDITLQVITNLDLPYLTSRLILHLAWKIHLQQGAKNVPVKGIDDNRQITVTFAVSAVGNFLPMQIIYTGNTERCLPNFDLPRDFNVAFTKNHEIYCYFLFSLGERFWAFWKLISPLFQKTKDKHRYTKEQRSLVVMKTFKGQDNDVLKDLRAKHFFRGCDCFARKFRDLMVFNWV